MTVELQPYQQALKGYGAYDCVVVERTEREWIEGGGAAIAARGSFVVDS